MKHIFIINGLAKKDGKRRKAFEHLLDGIAALKGDVEVQYTQPPEWGAEQIARAAAGTGEPVRLYACGGDGTLSQVVNGAAGFPNAAVTNVPLGTGNDFIKIFGDRYRELFSDLPALMEGPQAAFDLMDCNGRLGIDIVCAGVDARIADDVDKYKGVPLVTGIGAYILALIENVLLKTIHKPMRVRMGELDQSGEFSLVCVCNGRHYGGGFMPVGDAMPDDGVLDMLAVTGVSRATFLRLVGDYAKGRYKKYPELITEHHGQTVSFSSPNDEEVVTVIDGEVMRWREVTVKLSEKKVNFFYPAGASYAVR